MVGLQPRCRGGTRGKLSGDPAVITAAIALTLGVSDPLALLALEAHDYKIAVAALKKADEIRSEHEERLAKYTAVQTANFLAPMFSQLCKQIARSTMRG